MVDTFEYFKEVVGYKLKKNLMVSLEVSTIFLKYGGKYGY